MKQSILNIKTEFVKLKLRMERIQKKCSHINVKKEHSSNTGNYDPSADCYWTNFYCLDCDKHWQEEGSK